MPLRVSRCFFQFFFRCVFASAAVLPWVSAARAVEIRGLLDLRLVASDSERSWVGAGLDKTRFDRSSSAFRLGQAVLRIDGDLAPDFSASAVISASDDRFGLLDVNEAWVAWNPVPNSPWKTRVRAGAFFPTTSLEVGYDNIGWTPEHTVSSSAINSWLGEELRTLGVEFNVSRNGRLAGSPHTVGLTGALLFGNDPLGTLLAWRGWSVGDRISGLIESLPLADLRVFRAGGALPDQTRSINVFREIDDRPGFYVGTNYAYSSAAKTRFELAALHYDNRGDPLVIRSGQYSWHTRFNHVSLRLQGLGQWEFSAQLLEGNTLMGPNAVNLDYSAAYLLVSRPFGPGTVAVRVDQFNTRERPEDVIRSDSNSEHGRALALAYHWRIRPSLSLVSEALVVESVSDTAFSKAINTEGSESTTPFRADSCPAGGSSARARPRTRRRAWAC
jgi:hypothetical protein